MGDPVRDVTAPTLDQIVATHAGEEPPVRPRLRPSLDDIVVAATSLPSHLGGSRPDAILDYASRLPEQRDAQFQNSLALARKTRGLASEAEAADLAGRTGLPQDTVSRNLNTVREYVATRGVLPAGFKDRYPGTFNWLSNLDNAKLAQDDIGSLAGLEDAFRPPPQRASIATSYRRGVTALELGRLRVKQVEGRATPTEIARADSLSAELAQQPTEPALDWQQGYRPSLMVRAALGIPHAFRAAAEMFPATAEASLLGLRGALAGGLATGGVAAATGFGAPLAPEAATTGAIVGGSVAMAEAFRQQAKGQAVEELMKVRDVNGQPLPMNAIGPAADLVGVLNGAIALGPIDAVIHSLPGGNRIAAEGGTAALKLALEKPSVSAALQTWGANSAKIWGVGTAASVLQSAASQAGEKVAEEIAGGEFQPKSAGEIAQRITEDALHAAMAMAVMAPAMAAPGLFGNLRRASQATETAHQIEALGETAKASKLRERMPESYQEFAKTLGPVENVYVPVKAWDTFFQSQNIDPETAAREILAEPERYTQARALGENADVEIPRDEYAAKIAGTPIHEALKEDLRFRLGDMSTREARDFQTQLEDLAAEQRKLEATGETSAGQRIQDNLVAQLVATGMPKADAETNATMVRAFYQAQAARLGGGEAMVETLGQRFPISVSRGTLLTPEEARTPEGVTFRNKGRVKPLGVQSVEELYQYLGEKMGWLNETKINPSVWARDTGHGIVSGGSLGSAFIRQAQDRLAAIEAELEKRGQTKEQINDYLEQKFGGEAPLQKSTGGGITNEGLDALFGGPLEDAGRAAEQAAKEAEQAAADERAGMQLYQGPKRATGQERASITISPPGGIRSFTINLGEKADLSSFAHEAGHAFFEILGDLAAESDAPEGLKRDYAAALKALGVKERADLGTKEQEQLARWFEGYLREGRPPDLELAGMFQRFRAWLVQTYKNIQGYLGAPMNPDIRGVFDRMLATEETVKATREMMAYHPLFETAKEAGMTDAAFATYQRGGRDAEARTAETLTKALLEETNRQRREAWQTERARVHDAVLQEVNTDPMVRAHYYLRTGKMIDGTVLEGDRLRLSRDILTERYGQEIIKELPPGSTVKEDGVAPDVIATVFGLTPDQLIEGLRSFKDFNRDRFVNEETDRRMLERHGDLLHDSPALAIEAQQAAHNDAQSNQLLTELRALGNQLGIRVPPKIEALRLVASDMIRERRVGELTPYRFLQNEAKAARLAEESYKKGNIGAAHQAKRQQLLNHLLYKEAVDAQRKSDQMVAWARGTTSKDVQAVLGKAGPTFRDQFNALLEQYDFSRTTAKRDRELAVLAKWADEQQANDLPINLPPDVMSRIGKVPYRQLTYEQLIGVHDALRNILHVARHKNEMYAAEQAATLDDVARTASASIRENANRTVHERLGGRGGLGQAITGVQGFFAMHRKFDSLAREMDGGKDNGPMWRAVSLPLNRAADNEATRISNWVREWTRVISEHYSSADLAKMNFERLQSDLRDAAGRPEHLTKWDVLMMALNTGTEDNRTKLLDGYTKHLTPEILKGLLDRLDKRDWDFVQAVLDDINAFWPDIKAKQERLYGIAPEKVEASPIVTKYGTYKGGYFPLRYDADKSAKAYSESVAEQADLMKRGAFTQATTRRGHTIERVQGVQRPVLLSPNVITAHVRQVIHDLSHHEAILDVSRVLRHDDVRTAIEEHYGSTLYREMQATLRDVAAGDMGAATAIDRAANYLRTGTSTAVLGWNMVTSALQGFGLSNSIPRIGAKWVAVGIGKWLQSVPNSMDGGLGWIRERSEFMRNRANTQQRELNEILNTVRGSKVGDVRRSFFSFIARAQLIADVPTWLGAYEKAMSQEGMTEDTAVHLADQAVRDSQGSGQLKDLARVQRGNAAWKFFSTFYSYGSVLWNQNAEAFRKAGFKNPKSVSALLIDLAFINIVPGVLAYLTTQALKGQPVTAKGMAQDEAANLLNQLIGFREAVPFVRGQDYAGPSGLKIVPDLYRFGKQTEQGETDPAFWHAANQVAGTLFHYPANQLERTVQGAHAIFTGESQNPLVLIGGTPPPPR